MHIRPVTLADRAEWLRLLLALHEDSTAEEHIPSVDAYLAGASIGELLPTIVLVAARPAGGLGGLLELSVREYAEGCTGRTPYVESWVVDADLQGRGVGRALMAAAEGWARARGFTVIASDALASNRVSRAAHGALGFTEVVEIVVFQKPLGHPSTPVDPQVPA